VNLVPLASKKADPDKARAMLTTADAIFISGGDVEKGMQSLIDKNMVDFLRELNLNGKLFFGSSAGSLMLAKMWVRWRDPKDDTTAELFPCLDIAPVLCDAHAEADGFAELQTALTLAQNTDRGYGIASNTAIKCYPDGTVEAVGRPVWQFLKRGGKAVRIADLLPVK